MANKKISQLTDGTSFQPGDEAVVNRSGANFKVDPTQFSGFDLTAISTTIADTAVDVFVYDTSRDSDGGAWRHRTQHTSWYNETLNTSTRGSRREFPAVAVIVAKSNKVTIYDGDDPSLPMWIVMDRGGPVATQDMIGAGADGGNYSLVAKNGSIGAGMDGGLYVIDLLADTGKKFATSGVALYNADISDRNSGAGFGSFDASGAIVNSNVNDVAMTVLPNAPIDAATGLPVPTIAVATDGGVSVIKDDGTVVDSDYTDVAGFVGFLNNNYLVYQRGASGLAVCFVEDYSSDPFTTTENNTRTNAPYFSSVPTEIMDVANNNLVAFEVSNTALGRFSAKYGDYANSLYCETTPTYNTGWMNGDIKLATLSDTDDTDVTGSELVVDGDFTGDGSAWTLSNFVYDATNDQLDKLSSAAVATQAVSLPEGERYVVTVNLSNISGSVYFQVRYGGNSNTYTLLSSTIPTTDTFFVDTAVISAAQAGGDGLLYLNFQGAGTCSVDSVSIRKAEADRSVNGNGLQVYGTITKDPVATGADLVAYSGFSAANYLEQPYNSDLDFGTDDFCVMGWASGSSKDGYIFDRVDDPKVGERYRIFVNAGDLTAQIGSNSVSDAAPDGWMFFVARRLSGTLELFINGVSVDSVSDSTDVDNASAISWIGVNSGPGSAEYTGSLALLRISATAPTAEQIAKIYEDEKFLFQEGAQATLYGASDAVTALAHDEVTDLLHVGTSAGRSVFQGLRRVDNTTDAVGVAISAYDGLVAED